MVGKDYIEPTLLDRRGKFIDCRYPKSFAGDTNFLKGGCNGFGVTRIISQVQDFQR
jgi:hypothetical protein